VLQVSQPRQPGPEPPRIARSCSPLEAHTTESLGLLDVFLTIPESQFGVSGWLGRGKTTDSSSTWLFMAVLHFGAPGPRYSGVWPVARRGRVERVWPESGWTQVSGYTALVGREGNPSVPSAYVGIAAGAMSLLYTKESCFGMSQTPSTSKRKFHLKSFIATCIT
jgi:hypothetical protein